MSAHNYQPRYRPDIDGLRALAILPVVVYHVFPRYAPGGFVGVDIFFVISGYLISLILFKSLENGRFTFREFYARRIRRLFPALLLVAGACYAFGWFALLPDEFRQLGKHIAAGLGFVQNIVLWHEAGYFDAASAQKPLMHLWSLAIEEQFYLFYPLSIWLVWRSRLNVAACVAVLCAVSFLFSEREAGRNAAMAFFSPHTRFWELMLGALLAYTQMQTQTQAFQQRQPENSGHASGRSSNLGWRGPLANDLASFAGLLMIVYPVVAYESGMPYPGRYALVPVLGAGLLIHAGPQAWVNRHLLARGAMVGIGLISYALYLWHWPLISFVRIIGTEPLPLSWRAAVFALSFALAALTYRFVERPLRHAPLSWKTVTALCLLSLSLGVAGYDVYARNGLAFRVGKLNDLHAEYAELLPENASWFTTEESRKQCAQYLGLSDFAGHYCSLSRLAPPSVQLLGDSHAAALAHGLHTVFRESGQENLVHVGTNGCLVFPSLLSYPSQYLPAREACQAANRHAFHVAESRREIHTVILAARWPLYLHGTGYVHVDHADEKALSWEIASGTQADPAADRAALWAEGLRDTLGRLLAAGKAVIFVLDYPELGFEPRSCVDARPLRLSDKTAQPCAIARQDFDRRSEPYRRLAWSVLKDFPSVKVFDAAAPFCDEKYCWAAKDGAMLYFDDDHLSRQGSLIVARGLSRLLADRPADMPAQVRQ